MGFFCKFVIYKKKWKWKKLLDCSPLYVTVICSYKAIYNHFSLFIVQNVIAYAKNRVLEHDFFNDFFNQFKYLIFCKFLLRVEEILPKVEDLQFLCEIHLKNVIPLDRQKLTQIYNVHAKRIHSTLSQEKVFFDTKCIYVCVNTITQERAKEAKFHLRSLN